MSEENRMGLTIGLWFVSALMLGAVFIGAGMQSELTIGHIVLAITILVLAVTGTPFILRLKSEETESQREKSKRERIDSMIRDMSDEELMELKQKLSDGYYSEETLLDYLSDDGEMVLRK